MNYQLPGEMPLPDHKAVEYISVTKECRDQLKKLADEWNCSMGDIAEKVAHTVKIIVDYRDITGEGVAASVAAAINREYLENGVGDSDSRRTTIYSNRAVNNILKESRKMLRLTTSQILMIVAPMTRNMLVFDDVSKRAYEELKTDRGGVRDTRSYIAARSVYFDMANIMFKKLLHDMLQDHATSLSAGQVKEVEEYVDFRLPIGRFHEVMSGQPLEFDFMGEK